MKPRQLPPSERQIESARQCLQLAKDRRKAAQDTLDRHEDPTWFSTLDGQRSDLAADRAHAQEVLERPTPNMDDVAGEARETVVWVGRLRQAEYWLDRLDRAANVISDDLSGNSSQLYLMSQLYSISSTAWAEGASRIGQSMSRSVPAIDDPVGFDAASLGVGSLEAHNALLDGGEAAMREEVVSAAINLFNGGFHQIAQGATSDSWAVAVKENALTTIRRIRAPLAKRTSELKAVVDERIVNEKRILAYHEALDTLERFAQADDALAESQLERATVWSELVDGAPSSADPGALIDWARRTEARFVYIAGGNEVELAEVNYRSLILSDFAGIDTATHASYGTGRISSTPRSLTTRTGRGADKSAESGPSLA